MSAFLVMIDGTPLTQEARIMRLSVASLRQMVKGPLHVEFTRQQLRSYSGLEMLRTGRVRSFDAPRATSLRSEPVETQARVGHVWGHVDQPEGFDKGAS